MNHLARSIFGSIVWLVPTPAGGTVATSTAGEQVTGDVSPDLAEIRRRAASGPDPTSVVFTPEGGEAFRLLVVVIPGLEGALGLPVARFDDEVGGTVENLVNQVAHDVRNFAFAMGLQAELGERRAATPDVKGHFAAVLRQIDGLKLYLERLLLFGRPARLEVGDVAIEPLAREAVRRLQFGRDAAAAPVSVTVSVSDEVVGLRWDAAAISKALDALLDNAVRSADPAPPVRLDASLEGRTVRLSVSDNGRGIPSQTLPKLSVPMLVRRPGGAGLGLAIARKIAAAHGGEMVIESSASGTTVTLALPREAPTG